jgi:DNA repair exonuclease SbcCD ATPase subunit
MKNQTINQAISDKDMEILELQKQRLSFSQQAKDCEDQADKLTESDGDIDNLAQEISSLRTKAVILFKRESSTLAQIDEAEKQHQALHNDREKAIKEGLKAISNKAMEDLEKQLARLLPVFRQAQVALHYSGVYYSPGIVKAVLELGRVGIHGLDALLQDTTNEKQRLFIEMRASV